MPLRGVAFAVGLALLGATAFATISATRGFGSAHSWVTASVAAGVAVGALAIGSAWGERPILAAWLVLAILAGECFGFLSTAERLLAGREAEQVPLKAAAAAYSKAARRVANATDAVTNAPTMSLRLDGALAAKAAADGAARDKSTGRTCKDNCRALLQAQTDAADREVAEARAEIAIKARASNEELAVARANLAALKAPPSATPLADRLGAPAWAIDLTTAALGSMAANGLACGLIAFAGHRHREGRRTLVFNTEAAASPALLMPRDPAHAQRFAFEHLFPAQLGGATDVIAIKDAYRRWCADHGIVPLAGAALGQTLGELFDRVGIPLEERQGRLMAVGVALTGKHAMLNAFPSGSTSDKVSDHPPRPAFPSMACIAARGSEADSGALQPIVITRRFAGYAERTRAESLQDRHHLGDENIEYAREHGRQAQCNDR